MFLTTVRVIIILVSTLYCIVMSCIHVYWCSVYQHHRIFSVCIILIDFWLIIDRGILVELHGAAGVSLMSCDQIEMRDTAVVVGLQFCVKIKEVVQLSL